MTSIHRVAPATACFLLAITAPLVPSGSAGAAAVMVLAENDATAGNHQVVLSDAGLQPNDSSSISSTANVMSAAGDLVVFATTAALVASDDNALSDVYLRDQGADRTILISAKGDRPGNGDSHEPTMSEDGRYVAYTTASSNLAPRTRGNGLDVVVYDRQSRTTSLVSQSSSESTGRRNDFSPVIAGSGKAISFQSFSRLGPHDRDDREDIYVRKLSRGKTFQASLDVGRRRDIATNVANGDISFDGTRVVFGNDQDIWVRDLAARETVLLHHETSRAPCTGRSSGSAGRPTISGDGALVAFATCSRQLLGAPGPPEVFRVSVERLRTTRLTEGNSDAYLPSLSHDGRIVSFGSTSTNLVSNDDNDFADAFVLNIRSGRVRRISERGGAGGNGPSSSTAIAISADGHHVAYQTYASNLVPADMYDWQEVLVWSRG